MKNTHSLILTFLLCLFVASSCHRNQHPAISQCMTLAENHRPESALSLLQTLNRSRFSEAEAAHYALVYTLSQDKSGIDVSNDSLLRLAYNHYRTLPTDSLYSRCMYYMGKYYLLTDSAHAAAHCLHEAERAAAASCDTAVQCMALEKLSTLSHWYAPHQSLQYIDKALSLYAAYSQATFTNRIHLQLAKGENLVYNGRCKEALRLAEHLLPSVLQQGDSALVSNVYQDLSVFSLVDSNKVQARDYAQLSYRYAPVRNEHKLLALANSYFELGEDAACLRILDTLQTKKMSVVYNVFKLRHYIAVRQNSHNLVMNYADSAYTYLEKMYANTMLEKDRHYAESLRKGTALAQAQAQSSQQFYIIVVLIILVVSVVFVAIMVYNNKKKQQKLALENTQTKLQYEANLLKESQRMEAEKHELELKHKDVQLDMMRQFLIRKIELFNKLSPSDKSSANFLLEEMEWQEIEAFLENAENHFVSKLHTRFPQLDVSDYRFMMLLRLDLPSKSLARILGVNEGTIRHRSYILKQRLEITDKSVSLRQYLASLV